MEGAREYSFWHLLVRDVAYGQIPRRDRAQKHVAVARWLEQTVGERVADQAELLAHHYTEALRLSRASGEGDVTELTASTRRVLQLAGERAGRLDVPRAVSYYESALALWPETEPERLRAACELTRLLSEVGRAEEARDLGERELAALEDRADPVAIGWLRSLLGHIYFNLGDLDSAHREVERSVTLLERQPPTPELVYAYGRMGGREMFFEHWAAAIEICGKAIALAEELGVDESQVNLARQMQSVSRIGSGDLAGFEQLEDAIERAEAEGLSAASVAYVNLGSCRLWASGPESALEAYGRALDHSRRRGTWSLYRWAQAESLWALYDLGRWDDVLRVGDELLAAGVSGQVAAMVQPMRARVLLQRGDLDGAAVACASVLPLVREIGIPQVLGPALPVAASIAAARGDRDEALDLLRELVARGRDFPGLRVWYLGDSVRAAVAIGDRALGEGLMADIEPALEREVNAVLGGQAIVAEAAGDASRAIELFRRAAERWGEYGGVVERAHALAGLGRCAGDDRAAAEARSIFASLGTRAPRAPLSDAATG
jgi:tetratricopeptide (TPR) repeat protein